MPPTVNGILDAARVGKTRSLPALRPGQTTALLIIAGQSLAAGCSEGLYVPTNAGVVDNLNQFTGEMLKAADPLIGQALATPLTQQASPFTRVADQLVTAGKYQRVILAPVAIGGTTVSNWDASLYVNIVNAYLRAVALGIPTTAILWQQGETDSALGTSQAAYAASMTSVMNKVRAAGCTAPWILAKSTYTPGPGTSAAVRAAIDSLVNGSSVKAGPDCDTLDTSYRYDNQHWNTAGNVAAAALWKTAVQAAI